MASNQELLEKLGRSGDELEAAENDPAMQFQMQVLQAAKDAHEEGAPFLALEYRLMEALYGIYGLAIDAGELEDETLLDDGDLDEELLHRIDLIGSSRRALIRGVDEDIVESNLESALEDTADDETLASFYR
ncbi:hypothetical protein OB955_24575 [Halobacteria archaeon AArc-m2/3/4]|uniref:Uncharacterized protein n=1 Tax=Natronoglomus mannanivorans TaxID=2979990 RepID=A0AAP2YXY5_9EURY|nr:hypothetical protein [Halobacteria archaeon AArc-xg1-1]MCU4975860.1 hypothetical protein [Halobacteria archaeon AArc-m2/3/4]